jgi:putative PIN family toxin of toxin-antitoxin system
MDTNVLISAFVGHGKPRRLVFVLLERHQVVASPQMLAELIDVLSREKFAETDKQQAKSFLSILARKVFVVTAKRSFKAVPEDTDDDVVLNTAYEGKASHIISGDRHLLKLGNFRGIRIVTVNEMLELL